MATQFSLKFISNITFLKYLKNSYPKKITKIINDQLTAYLKEALYSKLFAMINLSFTEKSCNTDVS